MAVGSALSCWVALGFAMAACDDSASEDGIEESSDAGSPPDARAEAGRAKRDASNEAGERSYPECALRKAHVRHLVRDTIRGYVLQQLFVPSVVADTGTFHLTTSDAHLETTRCQVWDAEVDDCEFALKCSYRSYPKASDVALVAERIMRSTSDAATATLRGSDRFGAECELDVRLAAHERGDAATE